jgi:hypothetical protein
MWRAFAAVALLGATQCGAGSSGRGLSSSSPRETTDGALPVAADAAPSASEDCASSPTQDAVALGRSQPCDAGLHRAECRHVVFAAGRGQARRGIRDCKRDELHDRRAGHLDLGRCEREPSEAARRVRHSALSVTADGSLSIVSADFRQLNRARPGQAAVSSAQLDDADPSTTYALRSPSAPRGSGSRASNGTAG